MIGPFCSVIAETCRSLASLGMTHGSAPPVVQEIPPEAVHIADSFFVMIGIIVLGIPLIRALTRRWERSAQLPPPASPEITTRLERIEQAVEAVAIEVERIAEAQRFSAKLMAEQQKTLQKALPRIDSPPS